MTTLPPLPAQLAQALADKGYDALTPVQAAMLDPALAERDLLVSAQTGSGKTVAFGLAIAAQLVPEGERMPPPDTPQALIIAPTRELALQVTREFEWLYRSAGAVIASCVGGMDARTERRALDRGAHIVIGTPGRLRDHVERKSLDLSTLRAVVLDEADEMLDLGFREDLEFLLKASPEGRRTLMFSATVPRAIADLARTYQRDAARVATESAREAHVDIAYRALTVMPEDAENAIVNVLRFYEARNTLVFCKTRAAVNHLTARFLNRGMAVVPLSGELAQEERARALQAMRDGRARVCVATDVAARGIDLPGLELVIHADLPTNRETLLHRSGRTGRAGNKGVSVLIVPMSARRKAERLIQLAGVEAEWGPAPSAHDVSARDTERLLTDPALGGPEQAIESPLITMLTERFTARELAAAVGRYYFAAHSAPEDITQVSPDGPTKARPRNEFERSFWIRVAVGAAQRAEPRWLLPMLCRNGNLTKTDIGAIRIFEDQTLVQLHADCDERFFTALGAGMALEGGMAITRAEAPPERGEGPVARSPRPAREDSAPRPPRAARAPRVVAEPEGDSPAPSEVSAPAPAPRTFDDKPKPAYGADADRPARAPRPYNPDAPKRAYGDKPKPAYGAGAEGDARPPRKPRMTPTGAPSGAPKKSFGAARPARANADGSPRPERPRLDADAARNPSARLGPPKGAKRAPPGKPGAKPFGKPGPRPGGTDRPTRPKR